MNLWASLSKFRIVYNYFIEVWLKYMWRFPAVLIVADGGVLSLQEEMSMCEDGVVDLSLHVVTADSNSNSSQSVAPQMLLGLCVPNSCSQIDVQEILEDFAFKRQLKMTILRHRVLPRRYSFYSDPVFYAVVCVTLTVLNIYFVDGRTSQCTTYMPKGEIHKSKTYATVTVNFFRKCFSCYFVTVIAQNENLCNLLLQIQF